MERIIRCLFFFLPPYSPHLNLIEIIWRKTKYDWLSPAAYQKSDTFFTAIQAILVAFGTQFIVHFFPLKSIVYFGRAT